jgi:hypothetical protein
LTVLVATLLLHLMESYAAQTAARGATLKIVDALDMVLMAALVLLLMRQIMPIASALAGGIALSSFGSISRSLLWASRRGRTMGGTALAAIRISKSSSAHILGPSAAQSLVVERGNPIRNEGEPSWRAP